MRWSENDTYQFVKIYLSHELLWNTQLQAYKSKNERQKAYDEIITEFRATTGISLNEEELKNKIKNLRSTYTQEVSKIKRRSGPDMVFKPSIKWFSTWHKCFSSKSRNSLDVDASYFDLDEPENQPSQKVWVHQSENDNADNDHENSNSDPFVSDSDNYMLILKSEPDDEPLVKQEDIQTSYKIKRKKRESESVDSESTREDEFEIYGKYIASQLRQISLRKALRLQLEIQSLLSEARMSDLSET